MVTETVRVSFGFYNVLVSFFFCDAVLVLGDAVADEGCGIVFGSGELVG